MKELIGLFASVLVVFSFLFNGERSIRWINILGSIVFIVYGVLIKAWSIVLCNMALIIIHLYKLYFIETSK